MTKYYSNKPDFPGDPAYPLISSSSYFKSMSDIMDDIEAAGKVVTDEGVEDLYVQNGEASLGTTKDSAIFDKSMKRIYSMLTSAKKIHSDIMQNIDSKFTKGMDAAFVTLNDVNGANKPYKSKYTKQTVPKKVLAGYKADGTSVYIDTTEQKSYTLSEILDGKASPIQAAKDVYDDRIKAVKEMMAKKDQLSDEQIKALEGKSAEEIVAVRYPGQLPDYQRLKASRYYEENKESLQYVDMALKVVAFLGMAGGAILAPATGGTSLTVSYASMAYLAADSAYSAFNGHTMITGNQLSTEDRVWAGIDAAVTLVSMGSVGYLAKLAKSGKNGSTVLKGLATAGKHADDVNDVSKVIYSFATDQDPNAALQNLVLGQVMGLGMNSAGNYIGKKFGVPAVDVPSTKTSHLDIPLQGKQIPKLDPANVRLSSRPDLHLKASPADGTLAKLKTHPPVSVDLPKMKQIRADYNDYVAHKTSVGENPLSMSDWKLKVNNLKQNQTVGKEFKVAQTENFKQIASHVENRITIATTIDGQVKKVQVDAIGFDSNGKIRIQDYTASSNISSKRQAILDNIERNGGVIVGKGKGKFVGGVEIPKGTRIDVIKGGSQFSPEWQMYLNEFPKVQVDKNKVDEILKIQPNPDSGIFRPEPQEYLPKEYRQAHKELFDDGVAAFVKDDFFIQKFGNFGREDGAFVFPKDVAKAMIKEADGNPRKLEALLGLDEGSLGDTPKMVLPQEIHNYRIPDGNEGGSRDNSQWRPGGKTYPGGVPEAVIDPVPKDKVTLVDIW
ncbi:hypothetical protein NYE79_01835 [Streptococcus sp. FSL W8-0197]|uniref:hypothetical protein n=1 Tax=Streptococcus TaxID=1301 RepID=UPI0030D6D7E4